MVDQIGARSTLYLSSPTKYTKEFSADEVLASQQLKVDFLSIKCVFDAHFDIESNDKPL